MSNTLAYLFVFLAIGSILDYILLIFWVPFYFRFGLPLYVFRFPLSRRSLFWEIAPNMEKQQISSSYYPTAVFKRINETELVFKNKSLEFKIGFRTRTPYHGIIRLDSHSGTVTITGFISWLIPLAMIWTLFFFQSLYQPLIDKSKFLGGLDLMFSLVLILGLILGIQVFVLRHVGKQIYGIFLNESI